MMNMATPHADGQRPPPASQDDQSPRDNLSRPRRLWTAWTVASALSCAAGSASKLQSAPVALWDACVLRRVAVSVNLAIEVHEVDGEICPSMYPSSRIRRSKATQNVAVRGLTSDTTPIRSILGGVCARAASGHAITEPPSRLRTFLRFMGFPPGFEER